MKLILLSSTLNVKSDVCFFKINLTIIRDKKEQNLTLTLAKLSTAQSVAKEVGSIQGLEVSELTPTMKENYGIPSNIQGIFISQVAPNSKAEELGFREGDSIVQIESFSISDLKSFNDALKRYKGQPKRMLINRGGRIFSIVAK